jgi:hypothetical protein
LVTPGGRIISKSGCTMVLVEGPSTPNFRRQPRTSLIAAPVGFLPAILLCLAGNGKRVLDAQRK